MSEIVEGLEQKFVKWLKDIKNLTDNTCRNYTNRLKNKIPDRLNEVSFKNDKSSLYTYDIDELQKINVLFFTNKYGLQDWNRTPTIGQEAWNALKYLIEYKSRNINDEKGNLKMQNNPPQTQPLNQILYGPPGTGKTYNTINKALKIIFNIDTRNKSKEDIEKDLVDQAEQTIKINEIKLEEQKKDDKREKLKKVFEYYKEQGQIEFVTFHQSYGYEEFVEGIKAETNGNNITYEVKPGIFKKLCEKSSTKADINSLDFGNPNKIWKMSLGESGSKKANDIRQYCFDKNIVCLGFWITDIKFTGQNGYEIFKEMEKEHKNNPQLYPKNDDAKIESAHKTSRIINDMKKEDIVLISGDNLKTISGIAKVTGEYKILSEIDEEYPDFMKGYEQIREVKWLVKNIDIPIDGYLEEGKQQLGRGTIISNNTINLEKLKTLEIKSNTDKNYILIIDEINRGNISKIFGELITLIEDSKRLGKPEQVEITLPYCGEKFGVPQNLYIIGTMNTADRSIALMDTALRRRFDFTEMMPNLSVLSNDDKEIENYNYDSDKKENNDLIVSDINIRLLLKKINQRIEYLYDRDHTIGHAYFMELKDSDKQNIETLSNIFRNKIIPLLQEYFYDDWEKIRLVLGDNQKKDDNQQYQFIKIKKDYDTKKLFGDTLHELLDDEETKIYEINKSAFEKIESYKRIYE